MPDNHQARTDDMPPGKKNSHKVLTSVILIAIIIGIFALIGFS